VWAQTLFESYVNLIETGKAAGRPFETSQRHMADYVVAGMKAAPVEPTFIEQRDALLLAVHALSKGDPARTGDFEAIARGFAKRGLGVGAKAPPIASRAFDETVESFAFKAEVAISDVKVDDSLLSCDQDGILDASEAGILQLTLTNTGFQPLANSVLQLTSRDPAVRITEQPVPTLGPLQPYDSTILRFGVVVDPTKRGKSLFEIVASSTDPAAANVNVEFPFELRYNSDDVPASATSDDVESEHPAWVVSRDDAPKPDQDLNENSDSLIWSREGAAANHVWHGEDPSNSTDQSLVSPELNVSKDNPLVISFKHRFSFEFGTALTTGVGVGFDGGVLEVTRDGGKTWQDIEKYVDPGFTGKIFSTSTLKDRTLPDTNPLAGRMAWIGASANYPQYTPVSLNLGKDFAGKTIKLRFRIGTDDGTSATGWDIDDIAFGTAEAPSLTNTPFAAVHDNAGTCTVPTPVPNPVGSAR
jgi:hypothetical protein